MRIAMKSQTLRIMCLVAGLSLLPAAALTAQTPPPPPTGPGAPGGHGGPGGPGGMKRPGGSSAQDAKSAAASRNALQFGPVGRWWDDRSVAHQIGLSSQQQKKMDSIFNANRATIVESYKSFLNAQSNLEKVNKDASADKATVFAAVDAVNQARSALQKNTLAMLMQIREQMDAAQIEKLQKLQ
jgi:hypothetical protein